MHPGLDDQSAEVLDSPPELSHSSQEAAANKTEIPIVFNLGKNFKAFSSFDWNQVMKRSKVLAAPVEFSAADFLRSFAQLDNGPETKLFIENFIKYLDYSIGKSLLYRQERLHYMSLDKNRPISSLYSPTILIRFFSKLLVCATLPFNHLVARLNSVLQDYHSNPEISNFASYFSKLSE